MTADNRNSKKPFLVHSYYAMQEPKTKRFDDKDAAIKYAKARWRKELEETNLYKIKVWDTRLGGPFPNLVDAPGLLLELV